MVAWGKNTHIIYQNILSKSRPGHYFKRRFRVDLESRGKVFRATFRKGCAPFNFLPPHPPFFFCFLKLYLRHMEVPRLEVELKLQLLAYATATATPDSSLIFDLHHSSWQRWILNPLSGARDRTRVLMNTSWVCHW